MAADIASKPYDPSREYKHVYLCRKYPMIRLVYKRKEKAGDSEQYIGFLKHAAGGIFQTDSNEVAEFMDALIKDGEHGHQFEKITHEELGDLLSSVPAEQTRVNRGPTASRQTEKSEEPEPTESAPRRASGAKGPKGRRVAEPEEVEA